MRVYGLNFQSKMHWAGKNHKKKVGLRVRSEILHKKRGSFQKLQTKCVLSQIQMEVMKSFLFFEETYYFLSKNQNIGVIV